MLVNKLEYSTFSLKILHTQSTDIEIAPNTFFAYTPYIDCKMNQVRLMGQLNNNIYCNGCASKGISSTFFLKNNSFIVFREINYGIIHILFKM